MTLPLLVKGLKRIDQNETTESDALRQFLIQAATKLLISTSSQMDRPAIFETLLGLCDSEERKLEAIFTHGKLSGIKNLNKLYLEPMSSEVKATLAWIVTRIKLMKPSLSRDDLKDLETKSNALSSDKLNKL